MHGRLSVRKRRGVPACSPSSRPVTGRSSLSAAPGGREESPKVHMVIEIVLVWPTLPAW